MSGITARSAIPHGVFFRFVLMSLAGASTTETKSARLLLDGGALVEAWRSGRRFSGLRILGQEREGENRACDIVRFAFVIATVLCGMTLRDVLELEGVQLFVSILR